MIRLTTDAIDYAALTESVCRPDCGGVVLFLGTMRDLTDGRVITVSAGIRGVFLAMAEKKLAEIEQETRRRWPVGEMALVHRLGRLGVGERGERGGGRKLSAPRRSVRSVSLRHRPPQGACASVEKRELGRRKHRVGSSL